MASIARKHHERLEEADTRPKYREGRREKAVKVYTINLESRYLLVMGVPAIRVSEDLIKQFALYGDIEEYRRLDDYPHEEFTEVYWIKFCRISAARVAKRRLDDHSFMGGVLHVCYAPEYETVADTRDKLADRRSTIESKLIELSKHSKKVAKPQSNTKHSSFQSSVESSINPKLTYPIESLPSDVTTQCANPHIPTRTEVNAFSLPPPPGTQQYHSMRYPSMDPMDPDQPGPSQAKRPKALEPRPTNVSQTKIQSQASNVSLTDKPLLPRKVQLLKKSNKTLEKQKEEASPSSPPTFDLGFFSSPHSSQETIYRPYFAPVPEFTAPTAPQMGSVSLDVSAHSIRDKMNQLNYSSVLQNSSNNGENDNEDKQQETSRNQPIPLSVQPTKRRKDDKRKRI